MNDLAPQTWPCEDERDKRIRRLVRLLADSRRRNGALRQRNDALTADTIEQAGVLLAKLAAYEVEMARLRVEVDLLKGDYVETQRQLRLARGKAA